MFRTFLKESASRETLDGIYNRLTEFASAARNRGFAEAAKEMGLEVKETAPVGKGSPIQFIGAIPAAQQFAFDNKVGDISDVLENNSAVFVLQIKERRPKGVAPYEQVQEIVRRDFVGDVVRSTCTDTAKVLLGLISSGIGMKDAAERFKANFEESNLVSRDGRFDKLTYDPVLVGAAFSLKNPGDMTGVVNYRQGSLIMKLLDRTQPDLSAYNEKRDSIRTAIVTRKQQELYGRWFQQLRDSAQIVNNVQRQREAEEEAEDVG